MIVKEFYKTRKDGKKLFHTYSNEGLKIQKIGTDEVYDEAIDLEGQSFEYHEITEVEYAERMKEKEEEI